MTLTRDEVSAQITAALAGASKVAPKALIAALNAAAHFIESNVVADAVSTTSVPPSDGVSTALAPSFPLLASQCADELDEAMALKVGVMDSESKALAIAQQRIGAMQAVSARLREVAQA